MRRVFHADSGAFEFFQTPEDRMMSQLSKENQELKQRIDQLEKSLASRSTDKVAKDSPELTDLSSSELKQVCQELGINSGNAKVATLIGKIEDSGKTDEEIAAAIKSIK